MVLNFTGSVYTKKSMFYFGSWASSARMRSVLKTVTLFVKPSCSPNRALHLPSCILNRCCCYYYSVSSLGLDNDKYDRTPFFCKYFSLRADSLENWAQLSPNAMSWRAQNALLPSLALCFRKPGVWPVGERKAVRWERSPSVERGTRMKPDLIIKDEG